MFMLRKGSVLSGGKILKAILEAAILKIVI